MTTTPERVARELLQSMAVPDWAVTVWPLRKKSKRIHLIIRIHPQYPFDRQSLPKSFKGYQVSVEEDLPGET